MTAGTAFKVLTADQWMDFEREGLFHGCLLYTARCV